MPAVNFLAHLWKITRKPQSAILNQTAADAIYKPEFPATINPNALRFIFGTANSQAELGTQFYNTNCGDTVYWRSQIGGTSETVSVVQEMGIDYWMLTNTATRLIAIPQADYNSQITTALGNTVSRSLRSSSVCTDVSTTDFSYADNLVVTDIVYIDPADADAIANANNDFPQLNINFFTLGQTVGVNYGIQCQWQQTVNTTSYAIGSINTTDTVGSFAGAITAIAVYITNGQYALSVIHDNGNQTTEPVLITVGGNPLYANNHPTGDHAIAEFGITNITCLRTDGQPDNGGNILSLDSGLTEVITPLGFTDHDRPIVYDGTTYVPYYGGSGGDLTYGSGGEPSENEIELAISAQGITELDLTSGLYQDAEVVSYYYDWGNSTLIYEDAPGFMGKVTLFDSRNGAFKFKVKLKSSFAKLEQSQSIKITSLCTHEFGDENCTVNLIAQGLVDTLTISAITNGTTIVVNSTQADNYYGRIEFSKNGIIYSYNVASYDSASQSLGFWTSIADSGLVVGDQIRAIALCEKTTADCKRFQGNLLNHGGFPLVPDEQSILKVRSQE